MCSVKSIVIVHIRWRADMNQVFFTYKSIAIFEVGGQYFVVGLIGL